MDQGTSEWQQWRFEGIGSSDAPVIMGVSPYKTPRQLWIEKISKKQNDDDNTFIFEKGHKVEAQARSMIEIIYGGVEFRPGLCQMEDYPWLRASMDGANFDYEGGLGFEFKLVSKKEFDAGVCPVRYYPQVQHQYMVTGLRKIILVLCVCIGSQVRIKEVEVPMDLDYIQQRLAPTLSLFWNHHVKENVAPEYCQGDAVRIKDKYVLDLIKDDQDAYKKILKAIGDIKKLEQRIDMLRLNRQEFDSKITNKLVPGLWVSGKAKTTKYIQIESKKVAFRPCYSL